MLNRTIDNVSSKLDNDKVIHNILAEVVKKMNKSKIVTPQNKEAMSNYYRDIPKYNPPNVMKGGCEDIMRGTLIYYLSNTNKYDEMLVNKTSSYGLEIKETILLILLNNLYDVKIFCKSHNLNSDQTNNIVTLKKLSALHNLEHNF